MLYPALPVTGRLAQEAFTQRRQWFFDRMPPAQDEVLTSGESERLASQIGKRDVGSQP